MLINVFGKSPFLVIDVMLGFCMSFTKGSLFFIQTVYVEYSQVYWMHVDVAIHLLLPLDLVCV